MLDTMVETQVIENAVRLACRAPSLYNTQPWRWVADGPRLDLFLDVARVVHADRSMREAHIGCGGALEHLRVAVAAAGWSAEVDRFPDPDNPAHLARVTIAPTNAVTDEQRRRADAILRRRTDRLPFLAPVDWESLEAALRGRLGAGAVRLDVLPEEMRPRLAEAAAFTESLRLYDSSYHLELDWWTGPFEASEGIPYSSLISAAESKRVGVNRHFPFTRDLDRRAGVTRDFSKILMLSTEDDSHANALACGEVLSSVLLECTMAGLATCPVSQLTELSVSRELLAALTGHTDLPQVLIRVGVAPALDAAPPPTPRRALADVLRLTS
ncbi:Acg family FMN-binding oxidoreductase [Mycobacterium intracellulare]|uniref:Acg n=1 Tax=Mycobacterium intracellulare subsp. chimaera TaxID=222805 RepID=A0A220XTE0_MYCIT|nr:nitroreductase family protein [Mycobacterium intracellulare]ASL14582.1 Acg [Mycobacterium intracellulare subsp. chimaera]ASQ85821.1 NAD(P)H nitroreductase [Mycobacterium intracellulare subsp. chimaera]ASX00080.1 NAD(P)H nitroreductase [Mycobacterium intracellulare subsp. chimaera]MCF1812623.1 nitroreductase family protein [Mycobacterium intracellulare subsp. intracellulare]MDM3927365.1 nitroreductase family protein [Mycobacterium intracellulare subsp. chimaera]